jgi:foldase protein PrsA
MKFKNKILAIFKKFLKNKKKVQAFPKIIIISLVLIIFVGGLFYFKSRFIVAVVNGQPISRFSLINELEKQSGKKTLESLIIKTLIFQEAKKQKISVSKEEVNQEIKQLEESFSSQGQDFNQALEAQGMTRNQLQEQIEIQKIVEKIVSGSVHITEEEVEKYLEENKELFPEGTSTEDVKAEVKQQLENQRLSEEIQTWIESLKNNAKVTYL